MAWISTNELVQAQIDEFKNYANTSFDTTLAAINSITSSFSTIQSFPIDMGLTPSIDENTFPDYIKPTPVPVAPEIEFNDPDSPGDPMSEAEITNAFLTAKNRLDNIDVPQFTNTALPIRLPDHPDSEIPSAPDDPAPLIIPKYPDAPVLDEPSLPAIRDIGVLPVLDTPDLSAIEALIDELRGRIPVAPVMPELPNFGDLTSYYYTLTNNQLTAFVGSCSALASLCPRLTELLSGNSTGLSTSVEQGLRDRAFGAEDRQAFQAEQEALIDWLSRGFSLPGGALEAKLASIRQLNRDKKAQLGKEIWLESAKFEIENLRFAIQQGIAYEGLLRDSWAKVYSIAQAMAQTDIEVNLKILDSAISLYKIKMDGWQTEFSAIKDQLQIELAKLEIYKQELEGKRLIATLNQQDIDYYKTRWETLTIQVNLYKTRIDAANSLLQAELSKLEYSAKLVAIYAARISAYEAEWKAYSSAADAEKVKADIFESQTKAFASRVAAYASEVDAAKTIADLDVTTVKLMLESWQSQLEKYKSELQTELGRIDTLVKGSATESDVYKTKALVETAYTDFGMKKLEHGLAVDKLSADIELKEAELLQTRELSLAKMSLESLDGIARVGAQLTGSAMSAMNVGATLSSGSTTSDQYIEYHSYEET